MELDESDSPDEIVPPNEDGTIPLFSDSTLAEAFYLIDTDRSGSVTLREFVQSNRDAGTKQKLADLLGGDFFTLQMFQSVDDDNSRTIEIGEFKEWARRNWVRTDDNGKAIEVGGDEMPPEQPQLKNGMSKLEEDHELHEILRIYTQDLDREVTIQELGLNHREFWFLAEKEGEISDMLYERFHDHPREDLKLLE